MVCFIYPTFLVGNCGLKEETITKLVKDEVHEVIEEEAGEGENIGISTNTGEDGKFVWDHKATLLFLDEYGKLIDDFRNPMKKKKILWEKISAAMAAKGYQTDSGLLDRKMRNMKSTFNKIRDNNKKKRTGRARIHWEYYDKFCAIFAEDKTVNTDHLVASIRDDSCTSNEATSVDLDSATSISHSIGENTPSNSREKQKNLDVFRKRQLQIETEKLEELKKIRVALEENNKINKQKLNMFQQYLNRHQVNNQPEGQHASEVSTEDE